MTSDHECDDTVHVVQVGEPYSNASAVAVFTDRWRAKEYRRQLPAYEDDRLWTIIEDVPLDPGVDDAD